jgi:peptidoglycan/xylan/chitin deacetylase (PgdA/CDA1 family)
LSYTYSPPSIIKKLFIDFYWNTSNNKILLTFDDGPTAEATEIILKTLSGKKIKALFFCVGNNVKSNQSLVKDILDEGHLIGNHTYNHKRLTKIGNAQAIEEIVSFDDLMKEKFKYDVKYFRPPYGRFTISTGKILEDKSLKCVMWSLLTKDYKNDFEVVKFAVRNYLRKNSIIVLHDSLKSKDIIKDSINFIIDETKKNGFTFGEPEECLRQFS